MWLDRLNLCLFRWSLRQTRLLQSYVLLLALAVFLIPDPDDLSLCWSKQVDKMSQTFSCCFDVLFLVYDIWYSVHQKNYVFRTKYVPYTYLNISYSKWQKQTDIQFINILTSLNSCHLVVNSVAGKSTVPLCDNWNNRKSHMSTNSECCNWQPCQVHWLSCMFTSS